MSAKTIREFLGHDMYPNAEKLFSHIIRNYLGDRTPEDRTSRRLYGPDLIVPLGDNRQLLVEIKVNELSGRMPSSLYVRVLEQFDKWFSHYGALRPIALFISNYSFNPDMISRFQSRGVSLFTFDLDQTIPNVTSRLEDHLSKTVLRQNNIG